MVTMRERKIEEPKEVGEIFDAVEGLLEAIRVEGDANAKISAATAQLPKVIAAVDGYEKVSEEIKDASFFQAAGAFAGRIIAIFKK